MQLTLHRDVVQDYSGTRVVGAQIAVKTLAGSPASIYADAAGIAQIAGGIINSDASGEFQFWYRTGSTLQASIAVRPGSATKTVQIASAGQWTALTVDDLSRAEASFGSVAELVRDSASTSWKYTAGVFTSQIAADAAQDDYIATAADPTGLLGAWVRITAVPGTGSGVSSATSVEALASAPVEPDAPVQLIDGARSGMFIHRAGNFVDECAADPFMARYVPLPDDIIPGTSGAKVRQETGRIDLGWYGVDVTGVADATSRIQAALADVRASVASVAGSELTAWLALDMPPGAKLRINASLNATLIKGMRWRWNGATVIGYANMGLVIDMLGSSVCTVEKPHIVMATGYSARMGIAIGRCTQASFVRPPGDYTLHTAQGMTIIEPMFEGVYTGGGIINSCSEVNHIDSPTFVNDSPSAGPGTDSLSRPWSIIYDRFNDWRAAWPTLAEGAANGGSIYVTNVNPKGTCGGTLNGCTLSLMSARQPKIPAGSAGIWINGARNLPITYDGATVAAEMCVFVGDGGLGTDGLREDDTCFNVSLHGHFEYQQTFEDTGTQGVTFLLDARRWDWTARRFSWSDLTLHPKKAVIDVLGDYTVTFEDAELALNSVRTVSAAAYLVNPAKAGQVRFTGDTRISVNGAKHTKAPLFVSVTDGSTSAVIETGTHNYTAGQMSHWSDNSNPPQPLAAVGGVALFGRYPVESVTSSTVTITLPAQANNTVRGNAARDADAVWVYPAMYDLSAIAQLDGTVNAGAYHRLLKLPPGNAQVSGSDFATRIYKGTLERRGSTATTGYITDMPSTILGAGGGSGATWPPKEWDMVTNALGVVAGEKHPLYTAFVVTVASGVSFDGLTLAVDDIIFWNEDTGHYEELDQSGGSGASALTDIAELRATKPPAGTITRLVMGGRTGDFEVLYGSFAAQCAADPYQAIHVPFQTDIAAGTPGATGCHRRVESLRGAYKVEWAGLQFGDTDAVAADNGARIQSVINLAYGTTVDRSRSTVARIEFPDAGEIHSTGINFFRFDGFFVSGSAWMIFRAPNGICVDFGGAGKGKVSGCRWFMRANDAGVLPKIGVRLGRVDLPEELPYADGDYARKPAARNYFSSVQVSGKATRWTVWNNASEGTEWSGACYLENLFTGAVDTFDPALMSGIMALDRYNDCDLGMVSTVAPMSSPPGFAGGTHNQNALINVSLRSPSPYIVPLYINGPMQPTMERLQLVGGAKTFIVYGAGGFNENGLEENSCYSNDVSWHGESANDLVEQLYCVVFNTGARSIRLSRWNFNELRGHSTRAVLHVNGANDLQFDDIDLSLRAVLGGNRDCYLISPESKAKVSGYGSIYLEPVPDIYGSMNVTTTAASTQVTVQASKHRMLAGDVFQLWPADAKHVFAVADGITIGGEYTVLSVPDVDSFVIETGQMPTVGGVTNDIASGNVEAAINRSKITDLDACMASFDGTISGGAYPQFVKLPGGKNTLKGLGASALESASSDSSSVQAWCAANGVIYDPENFHIALQALVNACVPGAVPNVSGQTFTLPPGRFLRRASVIVPQRATGFNLRATPSTYILRTGDFSAWSVSARSSVVANPAIRANKWSIVGGWWGADYTPLPGMAFGDPDSFGSGPTGDEFALIVDDFICQPDGLIGMTGGRGVTPTGNRWTVGSMDHETPLVAFSAQGGSGGCRIGWGDGHNIYRLSGSSGDDYLQFVLNVNDNQPITNSHYWYCSGHSVEGRGMIVAVGARGPVSGYAEYSVGIKNCGYHYCNASGKLFDWRINAEAGPGGIDGVVFEHCGTFDAWSASPDKRGPAVKLVAVRFAAADGSTDVAMIDGLQFIDCNLSTTGSQALATSVKTGAGIEGKALSMVRAGGVVTAQLDTPHMSEVGKPITVVSATPAGFKGSFTVQSVVNATTITWLQAGANETATAGLVQVDYSAANAANAAARPPLGRFKIRGMKFGKAANFRPRGLESPTSPYAGMPRFNGNTRYAPDSSTSGNQFVLTPAVLSWDNIGSNDVVVWQTNRAVSGVGTVIFAGEPVEAIYSDATGTTPATLAWSSGQWVAIRHTPVSAATQCWFVYTADPLAIPGNPDDPAFDLAGYQSADIDGLEIDLVPGQMGARFTPNSDAGELLLRGPVKINGLAKGGLHPALTGLYAAQATPDVAIGFLLEGGSLTMRDRVQISKGASYTPDVNTLPVKLLGAAPSGEKGLRLNLDLRDWVGGNILIRASGVPYVLSDETLMPSDVGGGGTDDLTDSGPVASGVVPWNGADDYYRITTSGTGNITQISLPDGYDGKARRLTLVVIAATTRTFVNSTTSPANLSLDANVTLTQGQMMTVIYDPIDAVFRRVAEKVPVGGTYRVSIAADASSTDATALTDLTTLGIPVINGHAYWFQHMVRWQSAATTTGIAMTMGGTASGTLNAIFSTQVAADGAAAMFDGSITTLGDVVTGTGQQSAATSSAARLEGWFICTADGTLIPQFRTEVAASSVTVIAVGTNGIYTAF